MQKSLLFKLMILLLTVSACSNSKQITTQQQQPERVRGKVVKDVRVIKPVTPNQLPDNPHTKQQRQPIIVGKQSVPPANEPFTPPPPPPASEQPVAVDQNFPTNNNNKQEGEWVEIGTPTDSHQAPPPPIPTSNTGEWVEIGTAKTYEPPPPPPVEDTRVVIDRVPQEVPTAPEYVGPPPPTPPKAEAVVIMPPPPAPTPAPVYTPPAEANVPRYTPVPRPEPTAPAPKYIPVPPPSTTYTPPPTPVYNPPAPAPTPVYNPSTPPPAPVYTTPSTPPATTYTPPAPRSEFSSVSDLSAYLSVLQHRLDSLDAVKSNPHLTYNDITRVYKEEMAIHEEIKAKITILNSIREGTYTGNAIQPNTSNDYVVFKSEEGEPIVTAPPPPRYAKPSKPRYTPPKKKTAPKPKPKKKTSYKPPKKKTTSKPKSKPKPKKKTTSKPKPKKKTTSKPKAKTPPKKKAAKKKESKPKPPPKPKVKLVSVRQKELGSYFVEENPEKLNAYCLHRYAKVGSTIKVTNPMNQRSLSLKCIGRLPNLGNKTAIRITYSVARKLNIRDKHFDLLCKYKKEVKQ